MAAPAWNDRTDKAETKLGAGRIVTEDYEDVAVKLDYNADDNLGGFDRFGRLSDPFGDCQGVSFYLDANDNGLFDAGDTLLGEGDFDAASGRWLATVSTVGWGPSEAKVFARAAFDPASDHPPAVTQWETTLAVMANWAIIGPADPTGYIESGDGFSTVHASDAPGGAYRVMSGEDPDAYVEYTFTNLSPGNYEVWTHYAADAKYSTAVPIAVYDGSAATGALQQTFNLDETTLHWSNWEVGGYDWNWSDGVFYSNSGTVTVRVGVGADGVTQAPAIRLIAAPDSVACNAPASSDPVNLASGKMQSCGCGDDVEGTYYNNLSAGFLGDSGYGMTDARPALVGQGMLVTFTDAEGCPGDQWIEPVRNYTPQYGTKATLIDKGTYLELTQPDGTIHHFGYPTHDAYSIGPWMSTTLPGGRSETVTQWVTVAGKEKMGEIQYKSSPTAHAYYSEVFTYYDDLDPNAGLRESITYRNWDADASAWVNDQKVEYTYYETSQTELNGASGDLKTATVHYWDPTANGGSGGWSGGDTTYFRYYTGPTYEGEFPNEVFVGFAHGLKRKLLPEAYAKAAEYAAGLEPGNDQRGRVSLFLTNPREDVNLRTLCHDDCGFPAVEIKPDAVPVIDFAANPVRTASWTVYDDANHRTISAAGYQWYDTSVSQWKSTLVNPVSITVTNHDGDLTQQIQATAETTAIGTADPLASLAGETFTQTEYTAWTTYQYSRKQLVGTRTYHDIPASGDGVSGVNYDQTTLGYDALGRREWTESADGTIAWNVLDARGLVLSTWVGTDAVPTTDYNSDSVLDVGDFRYWLSQNPTATTGPAGTSMFLVSAAIYDYGNDGGDGLVTESRQYFDSGVNDYYATEYYYDWRNRLVEMTGPDPDGQGQLASAVTSYAYDNLDRMIEETDPLEHVTTYAYDDLGRQYRITQPDPDGEGDLQSPVTNYFYDPVGRLASLVDPVGNTTSWVYDGLGRMIEETNELDDTRYFEYDDAGNLIQETDRNGRATQYGYDALGRIVEEDWLDSQENVIWTISHAYDSAGRLESVGDDAAEYEYTYDDAGRVLTEMQTIAGLAPVMVFASQYDGDGNRTQLAAAIGENDDFVTDYYYDYLDRLDRIEQYGVQGGNAVAEKRVDLTYTLAGQFDTITRYKDLDGGSGNLVMTGTYGYDLAGRLTGLAYTDPLSATLRGFGWSYDAASRIIGHDSDIASEDVAANGYGYDATNQLTSADYTDANRDDESFAYDENGNRTEANGQTYGVPGAANRLSTDGYYTYKYDAEGNLEYRFMDEDASGDLTTGDTEVTEYTWDHRNRLTKVAYRPEVGEPVDWAVDYVYDSLNRRIASLYDSDGDATVDREERYVWDGNNIALDFVDPDGATGGEQSAPLALATRYLWGQAVDQLLAQETVDDGGPEDVAWPVTDNLGSVRSLADSTGAVTATYSYDTYGTVTVLEGSLTDTRYLYTCQEYDLATGLYYYNARWYDPATGRFVSEDPIEFDAEDENFYRYVGNSPVSHSDPSGMVSTIDDLEREAEKRRGKGPWKDSAQHCWAACMAAAIGTGVLGGCVTIAADIAELIHPSDDWLRDMWAHHVGATYGQVYFLYSLYPAVACDKICKINE